MPNVPKIIPKAIPFTWLNKSTLDEDANHEKMLMSLFISDLSMLMTVSDNS